jgi:hypothetical protein
MHILKKFHSDDSESMTLIDMKRPMLATFFDFPVFADGSRVTEEICDEGLLEVNYFFSL